MSQPSSEEFSVAYDPTPARRRVERWRRMIRTRIVSLGLSIVLMGVIFIWQRQQLMAHPGPTIIVYAVVLLSAVGWLVGVVVAHRLAVRAAAGVGDGRALRINRAGIEFAGQWVDWAQVASFGTVGGRWPSGPLLQLTRHDGGTIAVPLEQLAVLPAALDGATRAFSGGRFGVDLSALDA